MLSLVARRLVLLIPTLLLVTFGVFALQAIVPGDAAVFVAGGANASESRILEVREQLGLDDPFLVQYGRWLGDAVQLDLGTSTISGTGVASDLWSRLPVTLSILVGGLVCGLVLGVPVGLWSGAREGGFVDRVTLWTTSLGLAVPSFVVAVVLRSLVVTRWGWIKEAVGFTHPTSSDGLQLGGWLRSILLPSLSLGVGIAARLARTVRAGVIDTMHEPYVRTAWAKGCPPVSVIGRHVFKNAALSTVTIVGLLMGSLLGGTVLIEKIFGMSGVGDYLIRAIINKDLPVIQGATVMFVLGFVVINLVVDLMYGWLNPRVEVA